MDVRITLKQTVVFENRSITTETVSQIDDGYLGLVHTIKLVVDEFIRLRDTDLSNRTYAVVSGLAPLQPAETYQQAE